MYSQALSQTLEKNSYLAIVKELKLPNFDSALGDVEYNKPYDEIVWSWMKDQHRFEKRMNAAKILLENSPPNKLLNYLREAIKSPSHDKLIQAIEFFPECDDLDESLYIYMPDKINDHMLLATLPYIPEITRVNLTETSVTDEGLKALFYLPLLERVILEPPINKTTITGKGLVFICTHPSLKSLSAYNIAISDEELAGLIKNAANLNYLSINTNFLSDKGSRVLSKSKQLLTIILKHQYAMQKNVNHSHLTIDLFKTLSKCDNLKNISLSGYDFSLHPPDDIIHCIKTMDKKVQHISLRNCKVHPSLVKTFFEIKSLKSIHVSNITLFFNQNNPVSYEAFLETVKKKIP